MDTTFSWKILSKDDITGTMVVEYTVNDSVVTRLNVSQPPVDTNIADHVAKYVPFARTTQQEFAHVEVGADGSGSIPESPAPSETPTTSGSVNEQYLRGLIYQVLEEIRESQV